MPTPPVTAPEAAPEPVATATAPRIGWRAVLVIALVGLVLGGGGNLLTIGFHAGPRALTGAARSRVLWGEVAGAIWIVGAVWALKWWPLIGGEPLRRKALLVVPGIAVGSFAVLAALGGGFTKPGVGILVLNALLIGVVEELFFRGVLLAAALERFSASRAIWMVALFFGAGHIANVIFTNDLRTAVGQAAFAVVFGLWAGALRYRIGSIVPLVVIHALWDGTILTGVTAVGVAVLLAMPVLLFYAFWLMRGIARESQHNGGQLPADGYPPDHA